MKLHFALGTTVFAIFFFGAVSADFQFVNNCPYTMWPGILTGSSWPASTTGFELAYMASQTLTIPSPWSGRFWGRTGCSSSSSGRFVCETGDCGSGQVTCSGGAIPRASLVEITLNGSGTQDFYDTSLVDGFNLPIGIGPSGACQGSNCAANLNAACPPELQLIGAGGAIVGCKSTCLALKLEQYCCTGAHSTSETCPPTNYSKFFKAQCPQSYSYAFDDESSTFTCVTGANYVIKFCP